MHPVIILGAGSNGLALAQALKKVGIPCKIFDKAELLYKRKRRRAEAIVINKRAVEALRDILPAALYRALELRSSQMFELGPHTWHCDYQDLTDVLLADLQNEIHLSKDFVTVQATPSQVEVMLSDRTIITGSIVIGSDDTWKTHPAYAGRHAHPLSSLPGEDTNRAPKAGPATLRKRRISVPAESPVSVSSRAKRGRSTGASSITRISIPPSSRTAPRDKRAAASPASSTSSSASSLSSGAYRQSGPLQAANIFTELSTWHDSKLRQLWRDPSTPFDMGAWLQDSDLTILDTAGDGAVPPAAKMNLAAALHHAAIFDKAIRTEVCIEVTLQELGITIETLATDDDLRARPESLAPVTRNRRLVPWS